MRLSSFSVFLLILESAAAQTRLATPALGFAYDSSASAIRAVRGVPGAAVLGDVIDTGLELAAAEISPSQDFALAVSASDRRVRLVRWSEGQSPSVTLVGGAIESPGRLIFSPAGSAAVLADSHSGRLQLLTGLPDSFDLHEIPATSGAVVAVADNGSIALAVDDGVRVIGRDLNSFLLPLPAGVRALAFSRDGRNLAAVTHSGSLYVAKNVEAGADIRSVAVASIADAVAVRFSPDGSSVFVAEASGRLLSILLESGDASEIHCSCAPTGLHPLGRRGLLRVTDIANQPMFLFDTAADRPRVWFVPMADSRSAQ